MTAPARIEPSAALPAADEPGLAAPPGAPPDQPAAEPTAAPRRAAPVRWQRLQRMAADGVFAVLLLALVLTAGWLAARHDRTFDWSASARNSLAPESIALLERLPDADAAPLRITVFAPREHRIGRAVEQLLARYRRHRPDLQIHWVDPQAAPERAREADVRLLGQVVIEHQGRRETLEVLSEGTLSSAIARLTLARAPWVAVLEGHGERAMAGGAGPDIGRFAQLLRQRGFRLRPLDLASTGRVPDNTDLLVVTAPGIELFPGEADALVDYLAVGGNLLWLLDPGAGNADLRGLEPLAAYLGISALPGIVVDAQAAEHGFETPTFAVVDDWPAHALGRDLSRHAVLPGSLALRAGPAPGWRLATRLTSGEQSWNETGPIRGEVTRSPDLGETSGPLALALALSRPRPSPGAATPDATDANAAGRDAKAEPPDEQRVIVVGDGDFASNAHLGTGENRELALRMARWLTGLEDLIAPPPGPDDRDNFVLSAPRTWLIAVGGVFGLPLLLAGLGLWLTWRRGSA